MRGLFSILDGIPALFAPRPKPLALGGCGTDRDHAPVFGDIGPRSAVRILLLAAGEGMPPFGISEGLCTPALLPIGLCTPALFIAPDGFWVLREFLAASGRCVAPFQAGREPIP